ncbi:CatA-like O-acetyltransferase [Sneathiella litorea]|uniref:Chloramphenicol acetyltransferase n=1 Tax=Sneathiella litorea TaxID=2606216 RepID=A0A6L8W978_9PROT|nr:CatA-like O-acetyltransferase [Sneathiella litorea]MZR31012.1 chloramphenicol acetyltransferase [Sneathiella litorea]
MTAETIDFETWEGRHQYQMFRGHDIPHLSLTAGVDVTSLMQKHRSAKLSPFNAVLYAMMRAVNAIPEFRVRFRGETLLRHDRVHASFTVPIAKDQFGFCQTRFIEDWPRFDKDCRAAIERARQQTALQEGTSEEDDWIFLSCMPWLDFTSLTHPLFSRDDCIPRIAWGKITEERGRARISVNLQAHHALIDGLRAARFYEALQKNLDDFQA